MPVSFYPEYPEGISNNISDGFILSLYENIQPAAVKLIALLLGKSPGGANVEG
jgi:hypothetical protein